PAWLFTSRTKTWVSRISKIFSSFLAFTGAGSPVSGTHRTRDRDPATGMLLWKKKPSLRRGLRCRFLLGPGQKQDDQRPQQRHPCQAVERRCRISPGSLADAADHVRTEVTTKIADRVDQRDAGGCCRAGEECGRQ